PFSRRGWGIPGTAFGREEFAALAAKRTSQAGGRRGRGSRLSSAPGGLPSVPPRRCAPPNLQSRKQQPFRLLQADETMTIQNTLTTFAAAGMLTSAIAAHAQYAAVPA